MTSSGPRPGALGQRSPRPRAGLLLAAAGLLAAAVALGVAELVAGLVGPASSPLVAVGDAVIALVPEPVKDLAVALFGTRDKLALLVGTGAVIALYALVVGWLSLRRPRLAVLGIALFGLVGLLAATTRPAGSVLAGLPSLVGAAAGIVALLALRTALLPARGALLGAPTGEARPEGDPAATAGAPPRSVSADDDELSADDDERMLDRLRQALASADRTTVDRRRFLVAGGVALGVATVTGGGGRLLQRRFRVSEERAGVTLPAPSSPAPPLPPGADLANQVPGLSPLLTPNADFYRIDTAITVPQLRPSEYGLRVHGMVDRPRSYSLPELFGRSDLIERDITLTCVSNEVGGGLVGSARWIGVPLGALLRESGVHPASSQLVCRSSDGMTIGAPTGAALGTPDAMLAIGMNGEPLPVAHGFPVRMIIPGLYGYVSACKWLTDIEASTYPAFDAYWVRRGWAPEGPILLASRIDTPSPLRGFPAGPRAIAGVAWAQGRGIAAVEVRVDGGPWLSAQLSPAAEADLWRQWVLPHDFAAGSHEITVRATATDGEVQTERRTPPFPSGATGWHTIRVTAT